MRLRHRILFSVGTLVASVCLYVAVVVGLIGIPRLTSNRFWDGVFPILCLAAALLADFCLAWFWHRRTGKHLGATLFYSSVGIFLGAVLISMITMRGNWLEIMKELLQRI